MEFILHRSYFKEGTNGTLFSSGNGIGKFICHTIELAWNNNTRNVSCVPEGRYALQTRFSKKFKHHLLLKNVVNRSLILIHPANDAKKELKGCIAPVTYLNGIGKGLYSRDAMQKLLSLVYQAEARNESVFLIIKSVNYEFSRTL